MPELKAGGRTYNLYWVTGKVVAQGKYATTTVSGGGDVSVSSSTTIHNDIFLVDSNGKEHSFQLSNFNIACREGNQLTVIWAVQKGKKAGPCIIAINHTTSEQVFGPAIVGMFVRGAYVYLIIGISLLFLLYNFPPLKSSAAFLFGLFSNAYAKTTGIFDLLLGSIVVLFIICLILFVIFILWVLAALPAWVVFRIVGASKAKRFKSNFKFEDLQKERLN